MILTPYKKKEKKNYARISYRHECEPVIQMFNINTLHNIVPTAPNLVTQLNYVMLNVYASYIIIIIANNNLVYSKCSMSSCDMQAASWIDMVAWQHEANATYMHVVCTQIK
jgi:hypothetical protein